MARRVRWSVFLVAASCQMQQKQKRHPDPRRRTTPAQGRADWLLAAGVPVISLGDPTRLWVRVYVGPTLLTGLRVGQPVRATIDGVPGKEFRGTIVQIATRAEFTPRAFMDHGLITACPAASLPEGGEVMSRI